MAIDQIAMGFACVLLLPSMIFMAKNKETAKHAVEEAGLEKSVNDEALALAAYYLFLLGMVLFQLGCLVLGLTIGVPTPLATCAGTTGAITILLMMAITKQSITGIPGITGPPMPARVVLVIIGTVLNVNVVLHALDGDMDPSEWLKFGALYSVSIAVPHLVALKHRSAGWSTPPMV
jgi:hypothetical protein